MRSSGIISDVEASDGEGFLMSQTKKLDFAASYCHEIECLKLTITCQREIRFLLKP
jgi:hypothetical protein